MSSPWRPYYFLASGWIMGWFLILGLARLLDSYVALQLGLPLAGLVTGFFLGRGKLATRLILAGALGISWSLPIFLGLDLQLWWMAIVGIAVAGLVSSLVILVSQNRGFLK